MALQRFPIQEGMDLVDAVGVTRSSILFNSGPPVTAKADNLVRTSWWFDTSTGDVYWKARSGGGFDKWAKVQEDDVKQAEEIDFVITGAGPAEITTLYIGRAQPGAVTSGAVWSISKTVIQSGTDNDLKKTWADGVADFTKIWDDHLTITYV